MMFRFAAVRATAARLSLFFLILVALAFMTMSRVGGGLVEYVRAATSDLLLPGLELVARPVEILNQTMAAVHDLLNLYEDNERLRQELTRVRGWEAAARRLNAENQTLRQLLNVRADPQAQFRTARVVADSGGAFVRSLLVAAGTEDGIAKGQAATIGERLIGRVTEVGAKTARVLLLTDLNSRIPVVIERTRDRAILAGDNTAAARLLYLPQDGVLEPGDRIVTSGQGGGLPPGLLAGVVARISERGVQVDLMVDWGRIEFVSLVDYGALATGTLNAPPSTPPSTPAKAPLSVEPVR